MRGAGTNGAEALWKSVGTRLTFEKGHPGRDLEAGLKEIWTASGETCPQRPSCDRKIILAGVEFRKTPF